MNQRMGGIQNPPQCGLKVSRRRVALGIQIALDVLDRALQHEDLVAQAVQFGTLDDEFMLTQLELFGTLPGHPVPLSAGLAAELARTTG